MSSWESWGSQSEIGKSFCTSWCKLNSGLFAFTSVSLVRNENFSLLFFHTLQFIFRTVFSCCGFRCCWLWKFSWNKIKMLKEWKLWNVRRRRSRRELISIPIYLIRWIYHIFMRVITSKLIIKNSHGYLMKYVVCCFSMLLWKISRMLSVEICTQQSSEKMWRMIRKWEEFYHQMNWN